MTKIIFYLTGILLLTSCENELMEIKAATDIFRYPVQTTKDAHYVYTNKGAVSQVLDAPVIEVYSGDSSFIYAPNGLRIAFYNQSEKEEAVLVSNQGHFRQKSKIFYAEGQVQLTNSKGEYVKTDTLVFYQDSSLIKTSSYVTIKTLTGVLYGKGLISNSSFTDYHILQPTGKFQVEEPL
jgi:LPS export ABC transporter protein LptC